MGNETYVSIGNCKFTVVFTFNDPQSGWVQKLHCHASNEIIFIGNSKVNCYSHDKKLQLKENTVLLVPPKTEHYLSPIEEDCPTEKISFRVSFTKDTLTDDGHDMYTQFMRIFTNINQIILLDDDNIVNQFRLLLNMLNGTYSDSYIMANSVALILTNLLIKLKMDEKNVFVQCEEIKDHEFSMMARIESFIAENYMNNITLKDTAKRFSISERQVARFCNKVYKMNFKYILQRQRMLISKQLVENTSIPFNEIALNTGYNSYVGFYKSFNRYFSVPPSQMRSDKARNQLSDQINILAK